MIALLPRFAPKATSLTKSTPSAAPVPQTPAPAAPSAPQPRDNFLRLVSDALDGAPASSGDAVSVKSKDGAKVRDAASVTGQNPPSTADVAINLVVDPLPSPLLLPVAPRALVPPDLAASRPASKPFGRAANRKNQPAKMPVPAPKQTAPSTIIPKSAPSVPSASAKTALPAERAGAPANVQTTESVPMAPASDRAKNNAADAKTLSSAQAVPAQANTPTLTAPLHVKSKAASPISGGARIAPSSPGSVAPLTPDEAAEPAEQPSEANAENVRPLEEIVAVSSVAKAAPSASAQMAAPITAQWSQARFAAPALAASAKSAAAASKPAPFTKPNAAASKSALPQTNRPSLQSVAAAASPASPALQVNVDLAVKDPAAQKTQAPAIDLSLGTAVASEMPKSKAGETIATTPAPDEEKAQDSAATPGKPSAESLSATAAPPAPHQARQTAALHSRNLVSARLVSPQLTAAPPANAKPSSPPPDPNDKEPEAPEPSARTGSPPLTQSQASTSGMAVAPTEERMKTAADQNKIAGQATQKLPPVNGISSAAAIKAGGAGASLRLPIEFSTRDNTALPITMLSMPGASATPLAALSAAVGVSNNPQIDRLEQLITREAVSFRKTDADEIGVSLKIDADTQLFLQFAYRDGQTVAMLRCEKGDLPALSSHFGQLQESLARQNIQLQSSANGGDHRRNTSSARDQQQNAQNAQASMPAPRTRHNVKAATLTASSATKPKTPSRHGFESWA